MKKKILQYTKRMPQLLLGIFTLLVFLSSFVRLERREVMVLDSLPAGYYDKHVTDTVQHKQLHDYEWFYSIDVVHFSDGSVDTIISLPGAKPVIIDLEKVAYYEGCMKIQDNFMVNYKQGWYYGEWVPTNHEIPKQKQSKVSLRKLDEFRPEQRITLMVVPVITNKKTNAKDYFATMREVSAVTDERLNFEIFRRTRSHATELVLQSRKGKPKLRPLLAHAAYLAGGGKGIVPELCALQEAQTSALYCDNWIIDEKKIGFPRGDLTIASFYFRAAAERLLFSLDVSPKRQKDFKFVFVDSNTHSYEGQVIETERLGLNQLIASGLWKDEEGFKSLYMNRCLLLNAPYAFSLWSGGYLAGMKQKNVHALWSAGISLGAGLQMINDLYDMSPNNPNQFADLKTEKITLPYYLKSRALGSEDEKVIFVKDEMKKNILYYHEKAMYALECLPDNEGKRLIIQAIDVLKTSRLIA